MRATSWIDSAGVEHQEIPGDGYFRADGIFSSEVTVYFAKGSGADPSGASVQLCTGGWADKTPIVVDGALKSLSGLSTSSAQDVIPKRVVPAGGLFILVSGFVAPFLAAAVDQ